MKYIIFFIFAMFISKANAHPHVFVKTDINIKTDGRDATIIHNSWSFDEMFSLDIIENYDVNSDKKFSKDELKLLKEEAFNNLKEYDYFNFLYVGDKQVKPIDCKNFNAEIENGEILKYNFDLTIPKTKIADKSFSFSTHDPEFFISFEYKGEKMNILNKQCSYDLKEDKAHPIYMDMVFPMSFFIKCGGK